MLDGAAIGESGCANGAERVVCLCGSCVCANVQRGAWGLQDGKDAMEKLGRWEACNRVPPLGAPRLPVASLGRNVQPEP